MPISIEGVKSGGDPAQGLSVTWDDGGYDRKTGSGYNVRGSLVLSHW